jgi:hypothetical protein
VHYCYGMMLVIPVSYSRNPVFESRSGDRVYSGVPWLSVLVLGYFLTMLPAMYEGRLKSSWTGGSAPLLCLPLGNIVLGDRNINTLRILMHRPTSDSRRDCERSFVNPSRAENEVSLKFLYASSNRELSCSGLLSFYFVWQRAAQISQLYT